MKKTLGGALLALAFMFGIIATTSSTADAQWRNPSNGGYNNQQRQEGYQHGLNTGASDAQRRQSYSPERSRYFRNAPSQAFRNGFVQGYKQGYRQIAGNQGNGRYRNDGYYGNRGRNDGYYGNDGYNNAELNRGYQQGLNTGASDGQKGQSYDPQRSRHFKNASTQAFRDGFVRGYDEGYRQYSNGTYRRSNTGSILEQIFRRP